MNGKASKYIGKMARIMYDKMEQPPGTLKNLKRTLKRAWTRMPWVERKRYGND